MQTSPTLSIEYEYPIAFVLPGQGESYPYCHTWGKIGHLDGDSVHVTPYVKSCHRFECPVCYTDWMHQEAKEILRRLEAYIQTSHRHLVHYVVSPIPQKVSSKDEYIDLRNKSYRVLRNSGILGGVCIFHYFRHPSDLNDRTEICPDNPHWHVIGDGWDNGKQQDGWIVHRIGIRRSKAQLYKTIKYCLKWGSRGCSLNADLPPRKIEIETWFGVMSYNKLRVSKPSGDGRYCAVCMQYIPSKMFHEVVWLRGDPPDGFFEITWEEHGKSFILGGDAYY